MTAVELVGTALLPAEVVAVARGGAPVRLGAPGRDLMDASAAAVQRALHAPEAAYGVSTGFGSLANVVIPAHRRGELQRALLRSHAAGIGRPVEREVVRAMMLLRARTLSMGLSGARAVVAERMIALLNLGVTPVVPEHGSLGASGDLAPLAHCALALLGEGELDLPDGTRAAAGAALAQCGVAPLTLIAKEGLACINGTDGVLGMLVLAAHDLARLLRIADVTAAMSVEALLGTDRAFDAELVALRPQPGQQLSARNLRAMLAASEIVASHRTGDDRVQDAYSLRCAPQVTGAARDVLAHAETVANAELASAIDNPMVLPDGRIESCGNFHGAPLAFACDALAIAVSEVGAIAERRTDRLLDASRSAGLPPFLAPDAGVNSGVMLAQYTQAAMVAENRRLAAPASVGSLPTSAMQEDHVSMGWSAARKLRTVVANLARILAVELVCAARAIGDRPRPISSRKVAVR
ncbi:MAG: histidine ammonia-lyase [Actinobacteria bacterium]|nr:histidine ammonia-lyase [Actinomycetota bacterium]